MLGNSEFSESFDDPIDSCIFTTPTTGDFSELECCKESLRGSFTTANCISIVHSQPWVANPFTVSIRAEGKKRLVLD